MIIVGPCSIESQSQLFGIINQLKLYDIEYIRGGIWKYRSTASSFQGTNEAMDWIRQTKEEWDFKFVCEILTTHGIEDFIENYIDVIQIGSRNMYNTDLLKQVSEKFRHKPVIFKRHFSSSLQDFVNHSTYLKNENVSLVLRGIQTLHSHEQRFFPDFTDIPRLRELTSHPIIYDVSHSACHSKYVPSILEAANIFKPDGYMIEVHPDPSNALSDADQQLDYAEFNSIFENLERMKIWINK